MWLVIAYFLVYNFEFFVASWHLLACRVKGVGRSETKIYFWYRLFLMVLMVDNIVLSRVQHNLLIAHVCAYFIKFCNYALKRLFPSLWYYLFGHKTSSAHEYKNRFTWFATCPELHQQLLQMTSIHFKGIFYHALSITTQTKSQKALQKDCPHQGDS